MAKRFQMNVQQAQPLSVQVKGQIQPIAQGCPVQSQWCVICSYAVWNQGFADGETNPLCIVSVREDKIIPIPENAPRDRLVFNLLQGDDIGIQVIRIFFQPREIFIRSRIGPVSVGIAIIQMRDVPCRDPQRCFRPAGDAQTKQQHQQSEA